VLTLWASHTPHAQHHATVERMRQFLVSDPGCVFLWPWLRTRPASACRACAPVQTVDGAVAQAVPAGGAGQPCGAAAVRQRAAERAIAEQPRRVPFTISRGSSSACAGCLRRTTASRWPTHAMRTDNQNVRLGQHSV
jgi:hypothetical protein